MYEKKTFLEVSPPTYHGTLHREPSDLAACLIMQFEPLRLRAERGSDGDWLIGYGHVTRDIHATCTACQASQWLSEDLKACGSVVAELVRVPLMNNEFDALCCFVFNQGRLVFKHSRLLARLNNGNHRCVPEELLKWNKDSRGNGPIEALLEQRFAEAALWRA